jgi:hypothetical protein
MVIAVVATCLIVAILAFLCGMGVSLKAAVRKAMRDAGFTKDSIRLYGRAVKILRRLDGLTDLDGDLAGDILSPTTRKQVSEWLADYRKGLDNL